MGKQYFVYIMASKRNGTLYTGVTSDLIRRIKEHKSKKHEGFTQKYNINKLVWFDCTNEVNSALNEEKRIKDWKRKYKIDLIEKNNPNWMDLYPGLLDS